MKGRKRNIEAYRQTQETFSRERPPENSADSTKDLKTKRAGTAPAKAEKKDENLGGLLKTTGKESSYRKAAKFLMLVGKDEASSVLRHFSEDEIEIITREISRIKRIDTVEAEKLLTEFGFLKKSIRYPVGGVEAARRILVSAFGEEKGREILARSVPVEDPKLFSYLDALEPNQIHNLMKNETPMILAIILPYLSTEKASGLISLLTPGFRNELIRRMAKKNRISREVLIRMDEALREKARKYAAPVHTVEVDGKSALAEIFKFLDVSKEEELLERLAEDDPEIAEEIKERLFTIDILEFIDDKDLQKILHDMPDRDIALLLKGKNDVIRTRILRNLSERRKGFVTDEYKVLGAVLRRDVDEATKDFLTLLKRLEADGKLVIRRKWDEIIE